MRRRVDGGSYLASAALTDEAVAVLLGESVVVEAEAFDVRVRGNPACMRVVS